MLPCLTALIRRRPGASRLALLLCLPLAGPAADASAPDADLPAPLHQAFAQADIPPQAFSLLLVDANGQQAPLLSHRAEAPMNPASVMKLVTTFAALDLLGPAYQWRTPVWLDGPVQAGVLHGNLVIQGQGDPGLTQERAWLLLRQVQAAGIHTIDGDLVLDEGAFARDATQPGDFDGEPLKPYNAVARALPVNYQSVLLTFRPEPAAGRARVLVEPPLWGVKTPESLPLDTQDSRCVDETARLQPDFSDPLHLRLGGSYPLACGEKTWALAYPQPDAFAARVLRGLWAGMGGALTGQWRNAPAPTTPPSFVFSSPPLAELVRSINKFSNNLMAQQLFLTLGRLPDASAAAFDPLAAAAAGAPAPQASVQRSRSLLAQWWRQRLQAGTNTGAWPAPDLDNGSGLSRSQRISAASLARLLQVAHAWPYRSELAASLPIVGVDGTLRRSRAARASAHLKTGSLRDVAAIAGYVHGASGRTLALVALVNHPRASAARPALQALIDWASQQAQQP